MTKESLLEVSLAEPNKEVNESSKMILYWRDQNRWGEMHRRNRNTQNEAKGGLHLSSIIHTNKHLKALLKQ